jgi:glutaredoxin 2
MEADKLSQKNKASFPKACGVDKELKVLKKANDEYLNFIRSKSMVEAKLLQKVNDIAEGISNKLNRLAKTRQWNEHFDNFSPKEDGVEYFTNKLDDICFQEAEEHIKKGHKIYNALQEKRDNCRVIIHTGGDINNTVKTLQKEMATADIRLAIPNNLLQIASN